MRTFRSARSPALRSAAGKLKTSRDATKTGHVVLSLTAVVGGCMGSAKRRFEYRKMPRQIGNSKSEFCKGGLTMNGRRAFTIVASLAFLAPLLAAPAAANDATVSFNLVGPNITRAADGATLRTTGSGSFDSGAGTIVASGSFTHFLSNGTVFANGTWKATAFVSFRPFGGPNAGTQGGVLHLIVTLFPDGGAPVTGLSMSITCRINAPAGFTEEEGVTLDLFTEKIRGATQFHLNQ